MKHTAITMKKLLAAANKYCGLIEGLPICARCEHAHPVPDGEAGSERNVYCQVYSEKPKKVRRTEHCPLYRPDEFTIKIDLMPILRKRYGSRANAIMRLINSTAEGEG